jgi:phospholipid/cholesterol/gamma-HCH transport system permease protein
MQAIGADGLPVTSAANLLVGLIIGFLGVSQLGRFGAVVYVPELVVIAQFRELGPLVTAIVVAAVKCVWLSELATMQVSEETTRSVDGLQPSELVGRALSCARCRAAADMDWRPAGWVAGSSPRSPSPT